MLSEQRQYEITEWICREGKASIGELAEHFGVSGETIRRDLNLIVKQNRVRKVHGGAVAIRHPIRDESYAVRQVQNAYNKQKIGEYAARLIEDHSIVGIDSGTCAEALARAIYHVQDVTLITHSMPVATILAGKIAAGDFDGTVILLGGTVNPETCTLGGMSTLLQLESYHMDKVFLAATAISIDGIMAGDEADGQMTKAFLRRSEIAYVIAESEKLNRQSFYRASEFDEITVLITDDEHPMSSDLQVRIAESGTEIVCVPITQKK
ncbi:MAG: DeoR/GlpR transcriptional regulator [Clostridia bacterium]|nr:DeoR/GlpR transcriptional regulator [Clostridia bacterium]